MDDLDGEMIPRGNFTRLKTSPGDGRWCGTIWDTIPVCSGANLTSVRNIITALISAAVANDYPWKFTTSPQKYAQLLTFFFYSDIPKTSNYKIMEVSESASLCFH